MLSKRRVRTLARTKESGLLEKSIMVRTNVIPEISKEKTSVNRFRFFGINKAIIPAINGTSIE